MKRKYSKNELLGELKKLCIVCDTREKRHEHILSWLEENRIPCESRALATGDYTFRYRDLYFDDELIIEKKANLDEIAGNFTAERERFRREFIRAKACRTRMYLLIEDSDWRDILAHNYRSQMTPQSLFGSLMGWQAEFGVTVLFCPKELSGKVIYSLCYYWLKNRLENGG